VTRRVIDRTVKPRKHHSPHLPIIAVDQEIVIVERTKITYPRDQLAALLLLEPSSILTVHNAAVLTLNLHEEFKEIDNWQYRLTPMERELWTPNRKKKVVTSDTLVNFFGFQGDKKNPGRYFYPLDPIRFVRKSAFDISGTDWDTEASALLAFAQEVRAFLVSQQLRLSPTSGGIAAQLLRDPRFFPDDRRKVPRATNARARDVLPGNFYRLYKAEERVYYEAAYLDQSNAHHQAALSLSFPDPDALFARGRFREADAPDASDWLRRDSPEFSRFLSTHQGLVLARVYNPHLKGDQSFHLPCMDVPGLQLVYLYTNEIPYLESFPGAYVHSIIAAWTSPHINTGLNAYAKWAIGQVAEASKERRAWLKQTLLSGYGILAAKPRHTEFGFRKATGGVDKNYPVGPGFIPVKAFRTNKERETGIANVIYRGMIEAETRLVSLRLARELSDRKINVLAVYADSVFVENNAPLPFLPEPWKIQAHLTSLQFLNSTSFTSRELEKLPGIRREDREKLDSARAPLRKLGKERAQLP
jgi:hypothetical protein